MGVSQLKREFWKTTHPPIDIHFFQLLRQFISFPSILLEVKDKNFLKELSSTSSIV